MHDIFSREPDPLDGLLAPSPLPDTEALRQDLLDRTTRTLRRRRRLVRLTWTAAALAASILAAVLIVRFGSRTKPAPAPPEVVNQQESPPVIGPLAPADESALGLEWRAFDSTDHRSELYRQAADRYLTEEADPQSALRCIRNALDSATETDLTISPDDNWLLMAIKDARQKESSHAKNGG